MEKRVHTTVDRKGSLLDTERLTAPNPTELPTTPNLPTMSTKARVLVRQATFRSSKAINYQLAGLSDRRSLGIGWMCCFGIAGQFKDSLSWSVVAVAVWTSAVTYLVQYHADAAIHDYLENSAAVAAVYGGFLSFVLVFRTNVCYARWWEGRCLWGQLIFAAVQLSQQGAAWIDDESRKLRLVNMTVVFAWACKAQLRGHTLQSEPEEGRALVERGLLEEAELEEISEQSGWQPYYCLDVIRAVAEGSFCQQASEVRVPRVIALEATLTELSKAIGGSIRVKATGLPTSYDNFLGCFVALFFVTAPLAWAPGLAWYAPVLSTVLYTVIRALIVLGDQLEDPFGPDPCDHPLARFCRVVESQCTVVLKRHAKHGGRLLDLPPSERAAHAAHAANGTICEDGGGNGARTVAQPQKERAPWLASSGLSGPPRRKHSLPRFSQRFSQRFSRALEDERYDDWET